MYISEIFHDIIYFQVVTQQETREQLLRQLHNHVFHNIIKVQRVISYVYSISYSFPLFVKHAIIDISW